MNSWNVIPAKESDIDFVLLNGDRTIIRFTQRAEWLDIPWLMSKMEELNVPFAYTVGLKEIYFTMLQGLDGDYKNGLIRLSIGMGSRYTLDRTFVHELAHHVDEAEDISGRESIITEKKTSAKELVDTYARKNVCEYVAVGFEVFYCGSKKERSRLRKKNPKLYNVIRYIHRKYSAR